MASRCIFSVAKDFRTFHDVAPSQTSTAKKVYSLTQVARSIRMALERATGNKSWLIRAEILNITGDLGSKTVYVDLVEETNGRQSSKMRGIIWPQIGAEIARELGAEAKSILRPGAEVVFEARIEFHELYGVSLFIEKVDLRHMLGELERRKQATIAQLEKQGATHWNKRIPMPLVPQRIALVGSPGTSGFRDFVTKALLNGEGLRLIIESFPASVQGQAAPKELQQSIERAEASKPDLIVLVRGGGGKLDLDAFNDLELCLAIARCTVPIWTGIGHESDLVVADLVAHRSLKTPTDVAVSIVAELVNAASELEWMKLRMDKRVRLWRQVQDGQLGQWHQTLRWAGERFIREKQSELRQMHRSIGMIAPSFISRQRTKWSELERRFCWISQHLIQKEQEELIRVEKAIHQAYRLRLMAVRSEMANWSRTLHSLHPKQTLKRGFMLAEKNGTFVLRISDLHPQESFELVGHDGRIQVQPISPMKKESESQTDASS